MELEPLSVEQSMEWELWPEELPMELVTLSMG